MKTKKLLVWLLPLAILSMAQCRNETIEAYQETVYQRSAETAPEEVIIYTPTIEDDFDGSSVLVVLDKKTGGINKSHEMSFFGSFEMEYIRDLTEIIGDIDSLKYLNKEEFHQILKIKLPKDSKENVLDVIKQLEKVEGILYATPNYYLYPANAPNDPDYTNSTNTTGQWGLKNPTYGIKAPEAWNNTTGAKGILVGIIDTGIGPHPDLNDNVLPGWNFINNNSNTNDTDGHGTQVAGIVGAVGDNNIGIAGVCWDVGLVPLLISNGPYDSALFDRVISAITFATYANIDIINFSQYSVYATQAFVLAVQNYTGLFVCAAGNEGNDFINLQSYSVYSSLSQLSRVIIVGAMNSSGNKWSDSNFSKNIVHLFAPGDNILTTKIGGGYTHTPPVSGTSFAAPHVTGAAVLLKSVYPHLTTMQIRNAIINNVTKDTSKLGIYCTTGGRLDVQKVLNSQGTVIGYMDINYINNTRVIGRFYLFNNNTWAFVERGFFMNPMSPPASGNVVVPYIQMGSVPTAIANRLGNRTINTPIIVLIPATDPRMGIHHAGVTANFTITKNGVTITNPNIVSPFDADLMFSYIFKINNKQGSL